MSNNGIHAWKREYCVRDVHLFQAQYCDSDTRLSVSVITMETKQKRERQRHRGNISDRGCMMMMMMGHREKNHAIIPSGIDSSSVYFLGHIVRQLTVCFENHHFRKHQCITAKSEIVLTFTFPSSSACDWPPNDCFLQEKSLVQKNCVRNVSMIFMYS